MQKFLEVEELTCLRCLGAWIAKVENPKVCARCKSPYWKSPRKNYGEEGARNKYGFEMWELDKWYSLENFATADGGIDGDRNIKRWRSLAQFARRRGYITRFDGNTGKLYAMLKIDPASPLHIKKHG